MVKRTWADLTPTQKKLVIVTGVLEFAATAWCARDLHQRPASRVRGPKVLWAPVLSVQPFGPIAYVVWGRKG